MMFTMRKVVTRQTGTRRFWNLCRGKSIGYVESIYKGGVIFHTEFASFRETSSNLSNGAVIEMSISKLSAKDKELMEQCLHKKQPVMIQFSKELIGSPFKGDVFEARYINSIQSLNEEVVTVRDANMK
jgi:hypothetical protein